MKPSHQNTESAPEKELAEDIGLIYSPSVKKKRIVALSFDISSSYFRDILAGIHRFAQNNEGWSFNWVNRQQGVYGLGEEMPIEKLDGLISGYLTPNSAKLYRDTAVPVVCVSNRFDDLGFVKAVSDDYAVGRLAADYLLNRGFFSFGFIGYGDHFYSDQRRKGFIDRLYEVAGLDSPTAVPSGMVRIGERILLHCLPIGLPTTIASSVGIWLDELRKPCAVFAANDLRARTVLDACDRKGIPVPYEVAVLGVDDDFLQNVMSPIPVSSVKLDGETVGLRAAEALDQMMSGINNAPTLQPASPLKVITRYSSDVLAVEEPALRKALKWMQENYTSPVQMDEVVRVSGLSRRVLERRFREAMGRSPAEHMLELRVERARELLATTDWTIARISDQLGFSEPRTFIARFRDRCGQTPAAYRKNLGEAG